jgi:RHS repeat-associated protein
MEDYAGARYYNNNFGRFWSADPAGVKAVDPKNPVSWNQYAYVNNDPANFVDRRGLFLTAEDCIMDPDACGDEDWGHGGGSDPSGGGGGGDVPCNNPTASSFMSTGQDNVSCGEDPDPTPPPDCYAITIAAGIPGLTYDVASTIWSDGSLSAYLDDNTAATIAALAAVTWQGESSFTPYPTNQGNYSTTTHRLLSVDVGPFQINTRWNPNAGSAVLGTNTTPGQKFSGNPDANIAYGITILETLYKTWGNNAAGAYVTTDLGNPEARAREQTWNSEKSRLINLFSDTDCFAHQ